MLINSEEGRTSKKIIEEQEAQGYDRCWWGNLKAEAEEVGLVVNKTKVLGVKKSTWKKDVKNKIQEAFKHEFQTKKGNMNKLRFLNNKATDTYLQHLQNYDARMAIIIRLNLLETISHNFGVRKNCLLCGAWNDTTEHVFDCTGMEENDLTVDNLRQGTRMEEVIKLFREMERLRRDVLIESIITNFNVLHREEMEMNVNVN